jgi:hypothetical protein
LHCFKGYRTPVNATPNQLGGEDKCRNPS